MTFTIVHPEVNPEPTEEKQDNVDTAPGETPE